MAGLIAREKSWFCCLGSLGFGEMKFGGLEYVCMGCYVCLCVYVYQITGPQVPVSISEGGCFDDLYGRLKPCMGEGGGLR